METRFDKISYWLSQVGLFVMLCLSIAFVDANTERSTAQLVSFLLVGLLWGTASGTLRGYRKAILVEGKETTL
ncbi:MAG TPA: hypothetical protein PKD99_07705 [Sphingopyxis sp.]|nr:hypothetical protein [Sphingopyxis sp.]